MLFSGQQQILDSLKTMLEKVNQRSADMENKDKQIEQLTAQIAAMKQNEERLYADLETFREMEKKYKQIKEIL